MCRKKVYRSDVAGVSMVDRMCWKKATDEMFRKGAQTRFVEKGTDEIC